MRKSVKKKKKKKISKISSERSIRSYELQHREAALLNLLRDYPNQVIRGLAQQPEAEWTFGRLYLVGVISQRQYEAAQYLDRVTRDYERLLRHHSNLQTGSVTKTDSPVMEDLSLSAQKKFARAKRRYDEVYELLTQCGNDVKKAVVATLRRDEIVDLNAVQRGLTVLQTGLFSTGRRTR